MWNKETTVEQQKAAEFLTDCFHNTKDIGNAIISKDVLISKNLIKNQIKFVQMMLDNNDQNIDLSHVKLIEK